MSIPTDGGKRDEQERIVRVRETFERAYPAQIIRRGYRAAERAIRAAKGDAAQVALVVAVFVDFMATAEPDLPPEGRAVRLQQREQLRASLGLTEEAA